MTPHVYLSTACIHDLHEKCNKVCKYGEPEEWCVCECHTADVKPAARPLLVLVDDEMWTPATDAELLQLRTEIITFVAVDERGKAGERVAARLIGRIDAERTRNREMRERIAAALEEHIGPERPADQPMSVLMARAIAAVQNILKEYA